MLLSVAQVIGGYLSPVTDAYEKKVCGAEVIMLVLHH